MERKTYNDCSSATDLIVCAMQNAIVLFLERETLVKSLEAGNYLYHSTLNNALSAKASSQMVFHATIEIERYCIDHQDCRGELLQIFASELLAAIFHHGLSIHLLELQKHGGNIHKP